MTFSINTSTSTQATTYDIIGATSVDLSSVLTALYDNTDKEISPEVIRNSMLTAWSSSAFKQTLASQSNIYYIGVDSGNTIYSDKDVKSKVYFGKRAYSATSSYQLSHDIMTSNILNRVDDVFLYNTKRDTVSNNRTRVTILSGSTPSLFSTSPYIQSQIITSVGTYSALSLDIVNESINGGTNSLINFTSDYGTVSFNNIVFPTIQYSASTASNEKVLTWNNGQMIWDVMSFSVGNYIGTTGSATNIYGSPVNVNGYPLEFTDSRACPITIGDIQLGESFSSESIVEMLRRMVYPYLPPACSISIRAPYSSGYVEVGSSPIVRLDYTITKRSLPTLTTSLSYMIPSSYPPITNQGQTIITGSASGVVITPVTSATNSFSISVSDGTQSSTQTVTLKGIYPYFYGFSNLSTMTTAGLLSLNKIVEPKSDKLVDVTGSGNLYFIYDGDYPVLSNIFDELGNTISSSFSSSILTLSSPTGLWASKQFKVYQWNGVSQIGPPSVNYQFKY